MEAEDLDSSFVLNGDPSISLFPLISGQNKADRTTTFNSSAFSDRTPATSTLTFNSVFSDGDMLTPSLLSYCNNNPLTMPAPPQASNFTNIFSEDGNYYYTLPASEQLGFGHSVVVPPQLSPPLESTQPYDFFSPAPAPPVESSQPYDFFSSVPDESITTTRSVLNDPQTLESIIGNFKVVSKKPKRSAQTKKPKRSAFDSGTGSSSASLLTRQRINERVKCLRKLMPWITTKMDTATVLDEAFKYIMILQEQLRASVQSRPATSLDHHNHYCPCSNDHYNFVRGANVGGGGYGEAALSREQIMEMVLKANVGQNFVGCPS